MQARAIARSLPKRQQPQGQLWPRVNTRLRAQKEREIGYGGPTSGPKTPVKNEQHHCSCDIVPETPEKDVENHRFQNNGKSPLVNFRSLVDCISAKAATLSKAPRRQRFVLASDIKAIVEEITRHSSSTVHSASVTPNASPLAAAMSAIAVLKSPRLVKRELQRFRSSVTTKTEKVMRCRSALVPSSLVVSYDLNQIYRRHKRRSAILAEQAIRTPRATSHAQCT